MFWKPGDDLYLFLSNEHPRPWFLVFRDWVVLKDTQDRFRVVYFVDPSIEAPWNFASLEHCIDWIKGIRPTDNIGVTKGVKIQL